MERRRRGQGKAGVGRRGKKRGGGEGRREKGVIAYILRCRKVFIMALSVIAKD